MQEMLNDAVDLESLQADPAVAAILGNLDQSTRDAVERLLSSMNHSLIEAIIGACEQLDGQGVGAKELVALMKAKPVPVELDEAGREALRDLLGAAQATQNEIFSH